MNSLKKVSDFVQFRDLIRPLRRFGRKVVSSCYLFPSKIEKYICRGKVAYVEIANGVVFFFEQVDFYSLYFFLPLPLDDDQQNAIPFLIKPIILDLLFEDEKQFKESLALAEFWRSRGFVPYKKYIRFCLELPPGDRSSRFTSKFDREKYELDFAARGDMDGIRRLWYESLDPLSTPLPDEQELADLIDTKQIVCVRTKAGELAAVSRPEIRGNIAYNWHTVVDVPHRGQGLTNAMKSLLYLNYPDVTRFYVWMEEDNQRMIEIDLRTGYQPDGLMDIQYIYKNKPLQK
jgi:RimJ/RimL family protein N-acetyltransferase